MKQIPFFLCVYFNWLKKKAPISPQSHVVTKDRTNINKIKRKILCHKSIQ